MSLKKIAVGLACAAAATALVLVPASPAAAATTPGCLAQGSANNLIVPVAENNNPTCTMSMGHIRATAPVFTMQNTINVCYGTLLRQHGLALLVVDGSWGPKTDTAFRTVQNSIPGIAHDGIYGPQTRNNMRFISQDGVNNCLPY